MKQLNESFFRVICLSFSAVLLVLFLLTTIDIAAEKDRRGRLAHEVQKLSEENEVLRTRVEASLSMERIERYAREELGMQFCGASQLVVLEYTD